MLSAREAWFEGQLDLDPETLIFVDETGAWTRPGPAPRWRAGTDALPGACGFAWPCPTATG